MSRSTVLVVIVGLVALGHTACSEVAAPAPGTTCTPNPCLNGGTCIPGDERVTCECAPGWRSPLCEARDACAGAPCGVGSCSDAGAGGYTCLCPAGTFDSGTTCTTCRPVDNCETVSCTSIEDATCTDCRTGYSLRAGGCDAIVDCTGNPCGQGECTVTGVGSYRCDCHDGFYDRGGTCAGCDAIANCAVVSCSSAADETCATCATGYAPNGSGGCKDISDCFPNPCNGGTCTDTGVNSYDCSACPSGRYDNGTTCASCPAIANCTVATCTSAADTTCATCATGYAPNGSGGCKDISDCIPNPCNGGTCTDTGVNSYDCSACPPGKYDNGTTCASCDNIANCAVVSCTSAADETCATCATGYEPNGSGGCRDINDCSPNPCNGGTCTDTGVNSYDCSACPAGKYDDGTTCASCDAIANCTAVTCTSAANETCAACATGFERNGAGGCDDIDDCRSRPCGSGNEFRCTDIGPSAWRCDCPDGYFGDGGTSCTLCASSAVVGCNAVTCTAAGASTCAGCGVGYRLEGGSCINIDDCAGHAACGSQAWCVDGVATFSCDCPDGYFGDGTKACSPCSASPVTGCTAVTCTRADTSTCVACAAGYDLVSGTCRNIDDCQPGSCGVGRCIDGLSAFTCDCPDGTYGDGTTTCTACTPSSSPGCQAVTCTGPGPSTCTACAAGFTLSSGVCVDIDDCTGGRCAPGTCTDTGPSSWTCNCPDAFYGDGTTTCSACTPIEGCLALTCTSGGASTCSACASGYALSGGQCVNINDCPGHGCGVGICLDGINGYTCDCPVGTFGDGTTTCTACDTIPGCDSVRCTSANDEVCTCETSFDCHLAAPTCVVAGQTGTCVIVDECLGDDPYEHGDDGPAGAWFVSGPLAVIGDGLICGNAGTPSGDEADWFGITLNDGQDLRVMLAWTGPARDLDLEVYTADGQLIGSSAGTANPEDVSFADLSVGAYYLRVFSFSGDAANQAAGYVLTVDTECDGDFGFCPASAPVCLGAGASATCASVDVCAGDDAREPSDDGPRGASVATGPRTVFTGAICDSAQGAERDWYRVFVPDGGELRAKLAWTAPGVDLDLNVRDANGLVIGGGYSGLLDREEVDLGSLPGGDYYLELWSFGAPDTAVAYTFTVDAVAAGSFCDPSIFAFCPAQGPVCLGSGQATWCGTVDVCAGDDAREPADDGPRGASVAAGPRTVFASSICDSAQGAERDWYKVSVAAGQDLRAKVAWTTPGVDLDFYIRDGAGQIIQSATSGAGYIEELSLSGLAGGDYYVELWSHAGAPGTAVAYTMTLDTFTLDTPCDGYFAFCPAQAPACVGTGGAARCAIVDACNGDDAREHLDDGPQGAAFATGPRTVFTGAICDSGQGAERDWFRISVAAGQDLRAKVAWTTPGVDLDFYIRDGAGQIIQSGTSGAGYIEELSLSGLAGGDYYVELWSFAGAPDTAVAYTLTVDAVAAGSPCDPSIFAFCPAQGPVCLGSGQATWCGTVDVCAGDDAREPADDGPRGASVAAGPRTVFTGAICDSAQGAERDWYRVTVPDGGELRAKLTWTAPGVDLDFNIRDASGQVIREGLSVLAGLEEVDLGAIVGGDYYLELWSFTGAPDTAIAYTFTVDAVASGSPCDGLFGLCPSAAAACVGNHAAARCGVVDACAWDDAREPWDDGPAGATLVPSPGQSFDGYLCGGPEGPAAWESDWFRVEVDEGDVLYAAWLGDFDQAGDLDLVVRDNAGVLWGRSDAFANPDEIALSNLPAGAYYLELRAFDDEGSPAYYLLDVSTCPAADGCASPICTIAGAPYCLLCADGFDPDGNGGCEEHDACQPDPCQNGGTCVGTGPNQYWCMCQDGYVGPDCETFIGQCQTDFDCPIEEPVCWVDAGVGSCLASGGCLDDDLREELDDGPWGGSFVAAGETVVGRVCDTSGEYDWYWVTVEDEPLRVTLDWTATAADLDLYVFDEAGQVVASSAAFARPESIMLALAAHGDYWLRVSAYSGAPASAIEYTLQVTQECWGPIECPSWAPACIDAHCVVVDGCVDDDGWEHADDGPNGASWFALGTELDKRICGAHDAATAPESDWVAITLDAGQPLTVELAWDDASVDLDLYLIDSSGQVSLSSAGSDRPERITSANHPAGPYYAVVVGWSGAPVNAIDYRLSLGDIDDCSPDPCGGSGCTDTGVNSFQCGMQFHGGPVMTAPINVYYVWYGDWQGNTGTKILEDFARSVGGSPRWATNSTYTDAFGVPVSDTVSFAGRTFDGYSRGTALDYTDIWGIVADAIGTGWLPLDPDGVYFVLTAADVTVADLCTSYCGWHWFGGLDGVDVKYSLVANAELACPESCGVMDPSPNGNPGADAMANILMHELEEAATDPLLNAWYDGIGLENSDKCAWSFGEVYSTGAGALANVRLGARDFLIQQNWVNASGGYCALRYPPLTPSGALVPFSASRSTFAGAVPGHSARENPRFPVAAPRPATDGN